MITKNPIKQGQGEENHKKFFKMMSPIVALEDNIKEKNRNKALREIPKIIKIENIIQKLSKRVLHYDFFNEKIAKFIDRGYNKSWDTNITGEVILIFESISDEKFNVEGKCNLSLEEAMNY